jgi:hypothetical protein
MSNENQNGGSRALLERLFVAQLVKIFLAFYET